MLVAVGKMELKSCSISLYLCILSSVFISSHGHEGVRSGNVEPDDTADSKQKIEETKSSGPLPSWQLYMKVFEQNRGIQLDAVKRMQDYGKYEERFKLTDVLLKQLFKVLSETKVNLTEWGFMPEDPFPTNQTIREGVSKVLENTAMFGDMVLRLPDIVHRIYDKQREWHELIAWSIWFCKQTPVVEMSPNTAKLLHLMSQELNLIEREPEYSNPFTEENLKAKEEELEKQMNSKKEVKAEKKKKRKEKKKGPRLSGAIRVEL